MAAVRIIRPPTAFEHGDTVPRAQWANLLLERRSYCGVHLPQDCRNLVFFVEDGASNDWFGLGSRERYIREGLGLKPDVVGWALDGLRQLRPDEAATLDHAIVLGKRGRPRKGEKVVSQPFQRGTAEHWLARLDRDGRHELASAVRAGKLSANAAAIQAGYRRKLTELEELHRHWKRATAVERAAFLAEMRRRWLAGEPTGAGPWHKAPREAAKTDAGKGERR
jgi:hypothetical protein